ncbi:uncharacterized protein EAF01_002419 [Botrytis porri]|uniref:uncharacterized protein n=1 Tax=Botrytis porri TaxID=87229 RepID=UPI0018FFCF29|nr:uncharacterized protein EAF01_002419 [Botrytis porri]KAF7910910.1 hypothetical protein EAF01_002419 [Botrytis porri]
MYTDRPHIVSHTSKSLNQENEKSNLISLASSSDHEQGEPAIRGLCLVNPRMFPVFPVFPPLKQQTSNLSYSVTSTNPEFPREKKRIEEKACRLVSKKVSAKMSLHNYGLWSRTLRTSLAFCRFQSLAPILINLIPAYQFPWPVSLFPFKNRSSTAMFYLLISTGSVSPVISM